MFDDFFIRALIAGVGIAIVAGPLGCLVIWRRLSYFGDTLSHSALLGVTLAYSFSLNIAFSVFVISAVVALLLVSLQKRTKLAGDSLLGLLAHSTLAIGLVLIGFLSYIRFDLMGLLFGDILAVTTADIGLVWIGGIGTHPLYGTPEKYYIRKANSNGTTIWTHYYDDIRLNSLDKTYDGGYVFLGTKGGDGEGQFSLTKVDANGTTIWSNEYNSGSSGTHAGYSVDEALDGGFIMTGYRFTNLGSEGDMQIWIQKVDIDGNSEWNNGQSYRQFMYTI